MSYRELRRLIDEYRKAERDSETHITEYSLAEFIVSRATVCPHDWWSLFDRITDRWYHIPT
jgi:hypothetical protein